MLQWPWEYSLVQELRPSILMAHLEMRAGFDLGKASTETPQVEVSSVAWSLHVTLDLPLGHLS